MSITLSWKVFKVAYLSTKYEMENNPKKHKLLEELSQVISHSRFVDDNIVKENYFCFYTHHNRSIDVSMKEGILEFNLIVDQKIINLHKIVIPEVPNVRFVIKEKKLLIKYYDNREMKIQLSFICLDDLNDFANSLSKSMRTKHQDYEYTKLTKQWKLLIGEPKLIIEADTDTLHKNYNDLLHEFEYCAVNGINYKEFHKRKLNNI